MQTSITSFFKVTKTTVKRRETNDDEDDGENRRDHDRESDQEVFDDADDGDSCKSVLKTDTEDSVQEVTSSRKRLLESDDENEDFVPTNKTKKHHALSSTESTPVKDFGEKKQVETKTKGEQDKTTVEDKAETDKVDEKIEDKPEATNEKETEPAAKVNDNGKDQQKKVDNDQAMSPARPTIADKLMPKTTQSPLFSAEALIKKKISSGAHALHENIGVTWFRALQAEFDKPYFKKLSTFIEDQRKTKTVYPPPEQVFTWTHYHTIKDTRVIVIGQDPYHGPNQAHGLSFSVQKGVAVPRSLMNIYKELENDIPGFKNPGHGNLTGWSKQGVLMLNACLTVNKGEANSHQGKGWETFTDAAISWISKNANQNCVFLLWGRFAQQKSKIIDKRHKILTAAHPSPLSADNGFFGCKHFSQANAFLRSQKLPEIDWKAL